MGGGGLRCEGRKHVGALLRNCTTHLVPSTLAYLRTCVSVADPATLKVMLQTKHSSFKKDLPFTYKPFLPILGKGIVTADGKEWMRQRTRVSKVLRIDILDEIPSITLKAIQRLFKVIDSLPTDPEGGKVVEIAELFRHLALHVICEALLSVDADECDSKLVHMYLPIMDENNKQVWNPLRAYAFMCPFWWEHRRNIRVLDCYVEKIINDRHDLREKEKKSGGSERRKDVLDRVMGAYEDNEGWG